MKQCRMLTLASLCVSAIVQIAGCPVGAQLPPQEFVIGGVGDTVGLGLTASVQVFAPLSDLAVTGGSPIEVAWRATPTTRIAVIDVIIDVDVDPDNGNEIIAFDNLPLTETSALIDTSRLVAGDYFIGIRMEEIEAITAFDYAPGRVTINQRPELFFTSPRDNFTLDRSPLTNPRFDVAWTVSDPDSIISVQILLDPDSTPNANEILLRESNSQTGDSFPFNFPTASFDPGTYRFLALVTDSVDTFAFYSPGSITLRSRLASVIDLRDLDLPGGPVSGAVFEGFNPRDNAGSFLKSLGDLDQDGFADIMILAQFGKPQFQTNVQRTGVGEAYLIYGRADRFSGKINLNSTGRLFRGDVFTGVPEVPDPIRPTRGITSFTMLSDWDGDGFRELAFGVPFVDSAPVGSLGAGTGADFCATNDGPGYFRSGAVVVASSSSLRPDLGFPGQVVANLAEYGTLDYGDDAACPCPEGLYGPKAVAANIAYNCFHRHSILRPGISAPCIRGALRLGCRLSSNDFGDQFGETVSAWDFDSIIMSVPNRDPFVATFLNNTLNNSIEGAGVVSIYFVNRSGQFGGGFIPWATATDQVPQANAVFNYPGLAVMPFETIPHWGPYHYIVDDFRLFELPGGSIFPDDIDFAGHPGYTVDFDDSANPCVLGIDLRAPLPRNTVRIWGGFPGARIGNAVGIDDFSADGLLDMLVGSPLSHEGAGATFIVLGRLKDLMMAGEFNIDELGLPLNAPDAGNARIFDGIRVIGGPNDRLGQAQDGAGDFNNDGIGDVIIGSPLINGRRGGAAIFFGSREVINLTQEEIPFDEIPARGLGVIFVGEEDGDLAGARVAGVGDIDGDGNDDVLIAAPNRSVRLDI
ncbi:MAG: hypothetical protein IID33_01145, partial [Planctomycetes bacterium]|nr:hypothetical protein [Planctomycetota bacterium]